MSAAPVAANAEDKGRRVENDECRDVPEWEG